MTISTERAGGPARLASEFAGWLLMAIAAATLLGFLVRGRGFAEQAPWLISRAAGISAYLVLSASAIFGLLLSLRRAIQRLDRPAVFALHEHCSWVGLGFVTLHVGALLVDRYEPFSVVNVLVPFTAHYRPLWTGVGVLTLYLTVLLTASFYVRARIGHLTWRTLHYGSFAAFVMATFHGLFAGNSTGEPWMQTLYAAGAASVAALVAARLYLRTARPAPPRDAEARSTSTGGEPAPSLSTAQRLGGFRSRATEAEHRNLTLEVWRRPVEARAAVDERPGGS